MIDDRLRARADVALQLLAAQVEPAVADAQRLVDALLVELERQRRRARLRISSSSACTSISPVAIAGLTVSARALDDRAARADDELVAQLMRQLGRGGRVLRVDHDLDDAALVAQVDEDEPAEVAPPRDPAGERDRAALVARPQLAAELDRASVIGRERSDEVVERTTCSSAPAARIAASVARAITTVARAGPAGLRQLALERAAGVVGVGARARRGAARPAAASTLPAGPPSTTKKTSRPARCAAVPSFSSASSSRSMPAPKPIAGRRRPADLPRRARRSGRRRRSSSSRSPRARRTRTWCACSSRGRGRASARACTATP